MNTKTRKPWLQTIAMSLTFMLCASTSVMSFAADSTQVAMQRKTTPATPVAEPDTTQCAAADTNEHVWVAQNTNQMAPWKSSTCPSGYMPYQLQSFMRVLGVGVASGGVMDLRHYCCKVKIVYRSA